LTELSANVQDLEVREALQFYTLSGPLGQLLDADEDVLSSGRFLTFETENLLQLDDKAVIPVCFTCSAGLRSDWTVRRPWCRLMKPGHTSGTKCSGNGFGIG
jgi:Type IV secretory pathway, VirB4 components